MIPPTTEHTPPPWRVGAGSLIYGLGDTANAIGIMFTHRVGQKEADANAALAVQAVNRHAELVAALRESSQLLRDVITGKHKGGKELTLCHHQIATNVATLARLEARP